MKKIIRLSLLAALLIVAGCQNNSKIAAVETITITDNQVIYRVKGLKKAFKVLFLADSHITVEDERGKDFYAYTRRMGGSAVEANNYGISNGREQALMASVKKAEKDSAELLILGGDIINFPSAASVDLLLKIMNESTIDWVYTAGNHDWHYEGEPGKADEQRDKWEEASLNPLYQGANPLYSSKQLHGINFLFIDNSTNEVNDDQLSFLKNELKKELPIVLSVHIPFYIPGHTIDYGCGNPNWNKENDIYYEIERREPWPEKGHHKATIEFTKLALENPNIIGIYAGHSHEKIVDCVNNRLQYVVGANYNGSDVMIHFIPTEETTVHFSESSAISVMDGRVCQKSRVLKKFRHSLCICHSERQRRICYVAQGCAV